MQQQDLTTRQEIVEACRRMNALGINQGTSGNISVRDGGDLLITPTSLAYDRMTAADIVRLHADGSFDGDRPPSTEWRFHLAIMRAKSGVKAIVHNHSPYATTVAILERDIPPIHYMVAAGGGSSIRCAPYATFGTAELSDNAVKALDGRKACLLAHHGVIATGETLDQALWLAVEVETLARQYLGCLQAGEVRLLAEAEIDKVLARWAGYGLG
ncbi:MAG: class II aldolase/adducin family protein [Ancalomicrobiaceae bacterium]|nr:class II aldolase/adducin family protein [Ancalomicrobiaceae bacterium]